MLNLACLYQIMPVLIIINNTPIIIYIKVLCGHISLLLLNMYPGIELLVNFELNYP